MAESAERLATSEDLVQVPPHLVAEILAGKLVTHPRPAPRLALAGSSLGGELLGPFQKGRGGPGGWWILDEPELHLDADVAVPDIAGWRRERMPKLPETAWFGIAPDWVCEILSPSTARDDRVVKMPVYGLLGLATSGWSIRTCAPWRSTAWSRDAGSCWRATGTTPESPRRPSARSRSTSGTFGPEPPRRLVRSGSFD
jgi:hypothetical protein